MNVETVLRKIATAALAVLAVTVMGSAVTAGHQQIGVSQATKEWKAKPAHVVLATKEWKAATTATKEW